MKNKSSLFFSIKVVIRQCDTMGDILDIFSNDVFFFSEKNEGSL